MCSFSTLHCLFLLLDSKVVFHVYKITIINLILGFSATPSSLVV